MSAQLMLGKTYQATKELKVNTKLTGFRKNPSITIIAGEKFVLGYHGDPMIILSNDEGVLIKIEKAMLLLNSGAIELVGGDQ